MPRLLGKNCGLFDPNPMPSLYPIDEPYTSLVQHARGLLKRVKGWLGEAFFYRVVLRYRWKFAACFFLVEDFVRKYNYKEYHHLPEMYRSYGLRSIEDPGFRESVLADYCAFLNAHAGRDVILYFGAAGRRRGYDYLLKLAHDHQDLVFVHCGRHVANEMYDYDVDKLRESLQSSGRLFELVGRFIADFQLIDEFFCSTEYILLPYRHHYNSSGILVQAAEYGKPLLVPNVGYLNSLVTENAIGLTYKHLCYDDFEAQFARLRTEYALYTDNVRRFHQGHTKDQLYAALERGLGLADTGSRCT